MLELTGGRGADMVLDTIGGALFDPAVKSPRFGGRLTGRTRVAIRENCLASLLHSDNEHGRVTEVCRPVLSREEKESHDEPAVCSDLRLRRRRRARRFWAQALGQELDPGAGKAFASIGLRDSGRAEPRWCFAQVPEGKPGEPRTGRQPAGVLVPR